MTSRVQATFIGGEYPEVSGEWVATGKPGAESPKSTRPGNATVQVELDIEAQRLSEGDLKNKNGAILRRIASAYAVIRPGNPRQARTELSTFNPTHGADRSTGSLLPACVRP